MLSTCPMIPLTPSSLAFWAKTAACSMVGGHPIKAERAIHTMLPPALPPPTIIREASTPNDLALSLHYTKRHLAAALSMERPLSNPFKNVKAIVNGVWILVFRRPDEHQNVILHHGQYIMAGHTCGSQH